MANVPLSGVLSEDAVLYGAIRSCFSSTIGCVYVTLATAWHRLLLALLLPNVRTTGRLSLKRRRLGTAHSGDEKPGAGAEHVIVTINLGNAPEDKLVFDCGVPKQAKEATDAEKEW